MNVVCAQNIPNGFHHKNVHQISLLHINRVSVDAYTLNVLALCNFIDFVCNEKRSNFSMKQLMTKCMLPLYLFFVISVGAHLLGIVSTCTLHEAVLLHKSIPFTILQNAHDFATEDGTCKTGSRKTFPKVSRYCYHQCARRTCVDIKTPLKLTFQTFS